MFLDLTDANDDGMLIVMINHIVYFTPDTDTENTIICLTGDINLRVKESELEIRKKILNRT